MAQFQLPIRVLCADGQAVIVNLVRCLCAILQRMEHFFPVRESHGTPRALTERRSVRFFCCLEAASQLPKELLDTWTDY